MQPDQLPDNNFDFIGTEQVVEHLSFPRETVMTLKNSLADGGILKISVPDGSDIRAVLFMDMERCDGEPGKNHAAATDQTSQLLYSGIFA